MLRSVTYYILSIFWTKVYAGIQPTIKNISAEKGSAAGSPRLQAARQRLSPKGSVSAGEARHGIEKGDKSERDLSPFYFHPAIDEWAQIR